MRTTRGKRWWGWFALPAWLTAAPLHAITFDTDEPREGPHLEAEVRGTGRVGSGRTADPFELWFGTAAEFYKSDEFLFPDDQQTYYGQRIFLIYGVIPNFQLSLDTAFAYGTNDLVQPSPLKSFGDSRLGARYTRSVTRRASVGLDAGVGAFSGVPGRTSIADGVSFDLHHVGTVTLPRVDLHYDAGFLFDRSGRVVGDQPTLAEAAVYGLGSFHRIFLGAAAEARLGPVSPYAAWRAEWPLAAPIAATRGPQWLSGGIAWRYGLLFGHAGVAAALAEPRERGVPVPFPWLGDVGVGVAIDAAKLAHLAKQWLSPDPATLVLDAMDAYLKTPVDSANVSLYTPTGEQMGIGGIRWVGFASEVSYMVSADYYHPSTGTIDLTPGQRIRREVFLIPTHGRIRGSVQAPNPENASTLVISDGTDTVSSPVRGAYELPLLPGPYSGFFTAPEALSRPVEFNVNVGQITELGEVLLIQSTVRERRLADVAKGASQEKEQVWYFFDSRETNPSEAKSVPNPAEPATADVSDLLRDESEIFRDVRKVASGKAIGTAIAPGSAAVPAEVPAGGDRPVGSFAVGSYELSEVDRRKIRELAELLISDPSIRYVVIEGGADDTGTTTTNRELSQRRAYAVFTELRKYGIPEQKVAMKVAYFVRSSPEVREDDRAKDRRVAVRVFRD